MVNLFVRGIKSALKQRTGGFKRTLSGGGLASTLHFYCLLFRIDIRLSFLTENSLMVRNAFLVWTVMVSLGLIAGTAVSGNAADRKPNFLIILSDDVGWAEYGFQGSQDIPTPHIDSIAKNGVRFTQGYVSGTYCSPTRAGLLTGRYQTRFGHEFNSVAQRSGLDLNEKTLADRLKPLGYATCAVGK